MANTAFSILGRVIGLFAFLIGFPAAWALVSVLMGEGPDVPGSWRFALPLMLALLVAACWLAWRVAKALVRRGAGGQAHDTLPPRNR